MRQFNKTFQGHQQLENIYEILKHLSQDPKVSHITVFSGSWVFPGSISKTKHYLSLLKWLLLVWLVIFFRLVLFLQYFSWQNSKLYTFYEIIFYLCPPGVMDQLRTTVLKPKTFSSCVPLESYLSQSNPYLRKASVY